MIVTSFCSLHYHSVGRNRDTPTCAEASTTYCTYNNIKQMSGFDFFTLSLRRQRYFAPSTLYSSSSSAQNNTRTASTKRRAVINSSDRLSVHIPERVCVTMVIITQVHLDENIYIYYDTSVDGVFTIPTWLPTLFGFNRSTHPSFARVTRRVSGNESK